MVFKEDGHRFARFGFCLRVLAVPASSAAAAGIPLKVFILAGQSNTEEVTCEGV